MSQASELREATRLERRYRWLDAADMYRQALVSHKILGNDPEESSGIHLSISNCYRNAAYQTDDVSEFRNLINASIKALEMVLAVNEVSEGRKRARRTYLQSLIASSTEDKRRLLDDAIRELQKSIGTSADIRGSKHYIDIVTDLLHYIDARIDLARDYVEMRSLIDAAQSAGEPALKIGGGGGSSSSVLIRYLLSRILLDRPLAVYESTDKQRTSLVKSLENSERAYEGARSLKDASLIGETAGTLGYLTFELKGDLNSAYQLAELQLENAKYTRDNKQLALAYEFLSYVTSWKTNTVEGDPKRQTSENAKALKQSEDALKLFSLIGSPATICYISHTGSYNHLARIEEKIEEKKKILKEGVAEARKDLDIAEGSGSQVGRMFALNGYVQLLMRSLNLEDDAEQKIKILDEAETAANELNSLAGKVQPYKYWNLSVFKFQSTRLKMERASLEDSEEVKRKLLLEALKTGEECVRLSRLHLKKHPSNFFYIDYAVGLSKMGELLTKIHTVTGEAQYIEKAIEYYNEILGIYSKYDQPYRVAETHWQIASLYDKTSDYLRASREFEAASRSYEESINKIPSLNDFFLDYQRYMQAWSQISQAKHYSTQNQYDKVKNHYEKAASLHDQTKRWAYLKQNYATWARLAAAENLSIKGKAAEAIDAFKNIKKMFSGSEKIIESQIKSIEVYDEKLMAKEIMEASSNRIQYSQGRILLEEARLLDGEGDTAASSFKYDEAAELFQQIYESSNTKPERTELEPISKLCIAWGLMAKAEAESLPSLYIEASKAFDDARDSSVTPLTKEIAQGQSYFCKALYECAKYETSREYDDYQAARQLLTLASRSYTKSGYNRGYEYTKATERLFEAYMYIDKANQEADPDRKAKLFISAEKVLNESSRSYQKAGLPKKRTEIRKLIKDVKKEGQLALSLAQVFRGPKISLQTASFNLPQPTHEYPVGLSDFEHANVQVTTDDSSLEVNTNNPFNIVFAISNTGRAPASLIRIEHLLSDSLSCISISGLYSFKGKQIDLKGKHLPPSATEEITVTLNPLSKGKYKVTPRLVYLNDLNDNLTYNVKSIDLSVSDLGLSDWLRGPRERKTAR